MASKIRLNDEVIVIAGKDKKKTGKVVKVLTAEHKLYPGKGAQFARSAGAFCQILAREGDYVTLRMRSGEMRRVLADGRATIGEVGNSEHMLRQLGKAGAKRWLGVRPTVRGMSMNPIDHPHGGGEGRNKGIQPRSPWGTLCKGYKTRKNKRTDKYIVRRRDK